MQQKNHIYTSVNSEFEITVQPFFLEARSTPEKSNFMWSYHVQIENKGTKTCQLLNRFWKIMDASGRTTEVIGEGVIGKQPIIKPGELFEYTSGAPLKTPSGFMSGHYEMESETGEKFTVRIPDFSLDSPFVNASIH